MQILTNFLSLVKRRGIALFIIGLGVVGMIYILSGMLLQGNRLVVREVEYTPISLSKLPQRIAINTPAPDFSLKALDGKIYTLADFVGKKTLLYFWTTTCVFCERERPSLEKLFREFGDRINFVGINIGESEKRVSGYQQKSPYPFLILLDGDGSTAAAYFTIGTPNHAFIDENGMLIDFYRGYLSEERLRELLRV